MVFMELPSACSPSTNGSAGPSEYTAKWLHSKMPVRFLNLTKRMPLMRLS